MTTYNNYTFSLEQSLARLTSYYRNPIACCDYPQWLSEISYKPNWGMAIICEPNTIFGPPEYSKHRIIVVAVVTDAYHPDQMTQVAFNHILPGGLKRGQFIYAVRHHLLDCERHEFDEFFRINGVPFSNPH